VTDHKTSAEILLAEAAQQPTGSEVESSRQMQALVHATLFAGEQQRLANVIAAINEYNGISTNTTDWGFENWHAVMRYIRSGLGLS